MERAHHSTGRLVLGVSRWLLVALLNLLWLPFIVAVPALERRLLDELKRLAAEQLVGRVGERDEMLEQAREIVDV